MNLKAGLISLAGLALVVFSVLNWSPMSTPTQLDLAVATVEAPLGLILLAVVVVVTVAAALLVALYQTQMLVEVRRMEKESRSQRELAENAEASRLRDLAARIEQQFSQVTQHLEDQDRRWQAILDKAHGSLDNRIGEEMRSLAAQLGEIEDRLDRLLPPPRQTLHP